MQHIVDLETGVRGYIITGNDVFLEPYDRGRALLPGEFSALSRFLAEQASQKQMERLSNVQALLDRWFRDVATPEIETRRANGFSAGEAARSQAGKRLVDSMRQELAGMQAALQAQTVQMQRDATFSLRLVQGLVLLAFALVAGASALIGTNLSRRLGQALEGLSRVTRRVAAGHYDERAPRSDVYEVQEVAGHFNEMAAAIQTSQAEVQERHAALERQHEQVARLSEDAGRLAELTDTLQACYTLAEGYAVLQGMLPHIFPGWSGTVSVIAASRNLLTVQVSWGEARWRTPDLTSTPDMCWALRKGRTYTREHPITMSCIQQAPGHTHAYLCIPLVAQGETLGSLRLSADDPEQSSKETARARNFAEAVARQIALSIASLQLRDTLRNQSIRDALTGAFNRRYLEETLSRELVSAERNRRALSVLALDIDHFKRFNDTFGHDGGDAMLVAVAQEMQDFFRAEDVVCRYGGEEFVVVLLDTAHEDALARANGFRQAVHGLRVNLRGQPLGQVSVSIGVSTFPGDGTTPEGLVSAADEALYEAKRQGRDRVVSVSQLPAQGAIVPDMPKPQG